MSQDESKVAPWTVLSSATTYEDRWLKLRSDHCVSADGRDISPFHVIERSDWVNVVALTHAGQGIEESGFARVGVAEQRSGETARDRVDPGRQRKRRCGHDGDWTSTRAASLRRRLNR